ncbi:MAG: proline--tRNA ligase [Nanoarchaeota archaeon]|nr:proline--tRNA ligase [Nanoarchaeota archaeon]
MSEQEGLTVKKSKDFSEWYSQIIQKAELGDIRYNIKGFIVNRPWATMLMNNMYKLYEDELQKNGHLPVLFPTLIPASNLKQEEEHFKGFSAEVFWVTEGGSDYKKFEEKYALRPTSETAMYPMYALWIRSHRDLPLKLYQRCQVFRYESKMTRAFLRGREFWWIESHNAFTTREQAENQVLEDMRMSEDVMHQKFGIPFIFFNRPAWDKFPGAVYTYAADSLMPNGKITQQPSTHLLGQNFSKRLGIEFGDESGKKDFVWQTCYGPSIWRMVGSIIGLHGDDKGLILPPEISPYQIVIIPILTNKDKGKILSSAKKLFSKLKKSGFRVFLDERDFYSPGWKFNEWELKGVPLRVEIGPKDIQRKHVVFVRRDTGEKKFVTDRSLITSARKSLSDIQKSIVKRADNYFNDKMFVANNLKELSSNLKSGGFVQVPFCSVDLDGEGCAEKLKNDFAGVEVRGTRVDVKEKPKSSDKCVVCNRSAKVLVYVGKSY